MTAENSNNEPTPLVYLDIETTGLDVQRHQVWEVAWAVGDGEVESLVVRHTIDGADPRALKLNGYLDRVDPNAPWPFEVPLEFALRSATVVGANPAFDTKFLARRWNWEPWHHRLLDIETYAMPALGLDRPCGLAAIAEALDVVAPNHTAAGDVTTLRECHHRLAAIYSERFSKDGEAALVDAERRGAVRALREFGYRDVRDRANALEAGADL